MTPLDPIPIPSVAAGNPTTPGRIPGGESHAADLARAEAAEDRAEEVGPETDAIHREVPPED
jgi:hypothetical protein